MKTLLFCFTCILVFASLTVQISMAQIILQKAVISNGGGMTTDGSIRGSFVIGQAPVGTASSTQTTGHFGFFSTPNAVNTVAGEGAGPIRSLQLMPNPASEEVVITGALANAANVDLLLYDESGHLISTISSGKRDVGAFSARLSVKSLSSGVYFVAARMPGALLQTKLNVIK